MRPQAHEVVGGYYAPMIKHGSGWCERVKSGTGNKLKYVTRDMARERAAEEIVKRCAITAK